MKITTCKNRFEIILEGNEKETSTVSLVDEACGHLFEWLTSREVQSASQDNALPLASPASPPSRAND